MVKEKVAKAQVNVDMVWREREIMIINGETLNSAFLCQLHWAFQNESEIFLVMEFMQGGDLRYQMRLKDNVHKVRPLAEPVAKFYLAEILLALRSLHSVNIVYRDLKPENALLDSDGHLRLADFGIAINLQSQDGFKTAGRSGTYAYMSPEMLSREEYGTDVDIWAFGVTMYELLHADLPWAPLTSAATPQQVAAHYRAPLRLSSSLSNEAKHLLSRLLHLNPAKRITTCADLFAHPFFAGIDWPAMKRRAIAPPIKPEQGVANCTAAAALEVAFMDDPLQPLAPQLQELFDEYEYARPVAMERRPTLRDASSAQIPAAEMDERMKRVEKEWGEMQRESAADAATLAAEAAAVDAAGVTLQQHSEDESEFAPTSASGKAEAAAAAAAAAAAVAAAVASADASAGMNKGKGNGKGRSGGEGGSSRPAAVK
jgi:hypothetical protein